MSPFLIKVPLNSPNYLGLTFEKHFSSEKLREMQNIFKDMAQKHRHFPNLHSACRFMYLNLLNHVHFPAYFMTPTALRVVTMGLHKTQPMQLFKNTTLSATCLFSENEFIRFTTKGNEAVGLWVRKVTSKQGETILNQFLFNVELSAYYGDKRMQLKLFGDTYMSEVQLLLIQVINLLAFDNFKMN